MKLTIIVASTRPGRIGDQVGKWLAGYASQHTDFKVTVADLAELHKWSQALMPLHNPS